MSASPNFASTPKVGAGVVSTADTSRTSPTNAVTIFTAGSSGSRIDEINVVPLGTTTNNVVRLFVYNGSTYYLLQEVGIAANTPSAAFPVVTYTSSYENFFLPSGWSMVTSTNNDESYAVTAFGGDF